MNETTFVPETGAAAAATAPEASVFIARNDYRMDEADQKRTEFEALIRGQYKREFEERVKKIIDKRFREMRLLKEHADKMRPVIEALSEKYGESNLETLVRRLKEEAPISKMDERSKKAFLKAMIWRQEADEILRENPEFDLKTELKNGAFIALLKAGVDLKTAYRTLHQDEILSAAIRYAAKKAQERTMNDMRDRFLRPEENGAGGRGGSKVSPLSVVNMTRQEREEIEKRCARGEKVYFS